MKVINSLFLLAPCLSAFVIGCCVYFLITINSSQKVLTSNLREMEADALAARKVYVEVPPRVEYSLTELGRSLKPILDSLWTWGETYKRNANKT